MIHSDSTPPTDDQCDDNHPVHCSHFYDESLPCCFCGFDYSDGER